MSDERFEKPDGVYNEQGLRLGTVDHVIVNGKRYTMEGLSNSLTERLALVKQLEDARTRIREQNTRRVDFETKVHRAFAELVDDDDLDRDKANEVLDELGLDLVPVTYAWRATVVVRGTAESSLNEDDFVDWFRNNVSFEADTYGGAEVADFSPDSYDVDDLDVEQA
jgi:hypothetical protein